MVGDQRPVAEFLLFFRYSQKRVRTPGRTIQRWIAAGQVDIDLRTVRYGPRPPGSTQLDPYKAIVRQRLETYPELTAVRLFEEIKAARLPRQPHAAQGLCAPGPSPIGAGAAGPLRDAARQTGPTRLRPSPASLEQTLRLDGGARLFAPAVAPVLPASDHAHAHARARATAIIRGSHQGCGSTESCVRPQPLPQRCNGLPPRRPPSCVPRRSGDAGYSNGPVPRMAMARSISPALVFLRTRNSPFLPSSSRKRYG